MLFLVKLFALVITGWIFGFIVGVMTLDPYLAAGVFLLWAVLNQKTVMKESEPYAQD